MQYSKTNRNHPVKHETEVVCAIQNYTRQGHLHLLYLLGWAWRAKQKSLTNPLLSTSIEHTSPVASAKASKGIAPDEYPQQSNRILPSAPIHFLKRFTLIQTDLWGMAHPNSAHNRAPLLYTANKCHRESQLHACSLLCQNQPCSIGRRTNVAVAHWREKAQEM